MAEITLRNVRKTYGKVEVIHNLSVSIADGEFVVLVGPSGCGKSTLLRMIAGLEEISAGEISIAGRVVNDLDPKDRDVAMVFQNYALYPHKTVAENMGFSLKLRGENPDAVQRRVTKAAETLGLTEYLDRLPRALSGGQRQRVAMGRAIVRDPAAFLFDEPLSNLDAALRVQMRAEIRALHDRLSATSVFVTHDQIEAMTMADKIVILRDGIIEQVGAPIDIYNQPKNLFVAGFIGSPAMNQISGVADSGSIRLSESISVPCDSGINGSVFWGMRPEHIKQVTASTPGAFSVKVSIVEHTGMLSLIVAETGEIRLSATFTDAGEIRRGDTLWLRPQYEKQHVFDVQSGLRI